MISLNIFIALGAMSCWGFGDFLIQKATRKIGDLETLAWIGLLGSFGILPFVWHDFSLVATRSNLIVLLALGVISFVVGIINFEALKRGKLSVVQVIFEAELPVAVLLGLFFLGETLSLVQIGIIVLVFVGILLVAAKPKEIQRKHFFEKGVVLALVAAVGYGLIDFLTAVGAKTVSPLLTIWFSWAMFTVICFAYMTSRGRLLQFFRDAAKYKTLVLAMGIIDTLAWILFAVALRGNELGVTVAVTESYPVISLMLGVMINKEEVTRLQYCGAALAIVASVAMGFFIR